ncbi:putative transcription factor At5g28040 [Bidens hawaiensis]|uniref:putative transcription factor At5g28040 n=1 Tax=Bidens hawaiensis TaxID=980011 RepID=UPI00404AC1FB
MASDDEDHTATVYGEEDFIDDDEEEDVDLIDEDDDNDNDDDSTSSASGEAAGEVTIAVAGVPNVSTPIAVTPVQSTPGSIVRSEPVEPKKPLDDSRRLFQRLWTDEDEIELLQGFLDYTSQRGTSNSHHHDTTAFYDQIKGKLQLEFNKNQLVEKLRRLKKKYRNVLAKTSAGKEYVFKSPHDQATFDLSCKIWNEPAAAAVSIAAIDNEETQNPSLGLNLNDNNGNGIGIGSGEPNSSEKKVPRPRKRARSSAVKIEENYNQTQHYAQAAGAGTGMGAGALNSNAVNAATANLVEETVKSCLLPLFKELVNSSSNGASGNSRGFGLGLGGMNFPIGDMNDEKWRKQQILELEVYSKRLELMQDQVKSSLEELRSMGNS